MGAVLDPHAAPSASRFWRAAWARRNCTLVFRASRIMMADCTLTFSSPNAPSKRDVLGTVLLSVLSGHYRYAHITTLRNDTVNSRLLGMKKVMSEDAVRRGLAKIDEAAGLAWLRTRLDHCSRC
jgi:hypothetical protein